MAEVADAPARRIIHHYRRIVPASASELTSEFWIDEAGFACSWSLECGHYVPAPSGEVIHRREVWPETMPCPHCRDGDPITRLLEGDAPFGAYPEYVEYDPIFPTPPTPRFLPPAGGHPNCRGTLTPAAPPNGRKTARRAFWDGFRHAAPRALLLALVVAYIWFIVQAVAFIVESATR